MSTVLDLISGSLRLIQSLASGESVPASESQDALSALNQMIGSWSTENLLVYSTPREIFPLVAGQSQYFMGIGAVDFNTDKPMDIQAAGINVMTQSPVLELPLEIINLEQWSQIPIKTTQSSIPRRLYCEMTYPQATLNLWPVPSAANSIVIYSKKQLTQFASINTTLSLPPGYEKTLKYGLAIELAPEYGKQLAPEIGAVYAEAKESIKRQNIKPVYLNCDEATLSNRKPFSILRGD